MIQENIPVLIVGGGAAGLSASIFLSHHGIRSLLVERHSSTSIHPRGRGFNARVMELYRELGLEGAINEAGKDLQPAKGFLKGSTLAEAFANADKEPEPDSEQWARLMAIMAAQKEISPTSSSRGTQDLVEPILLAEASKRGGDVRFSTELLSFEQDETGVSARVRNRSDGTESQLRAQYMLGADGANSAVLRALSIPYRGSGILGHLLNILVEADLRSVVQGREFSQWLIERPEMKGVLLAINNRNIWTLHVPYDPQKGEKPEDFPPEHWEALLPSVLGLPRAEIKVKGILPWTASVRVAQSFQQGRIFLAGDAAHEVTPWGGLGANTGISDVHNLAWKLALVLKGVARPALLDTYNSERQPVGQAVVEFSHSQTGEDGLATRERFEPGAAMFMLSGFASQMLSGHGYKYASQAVVEEEGSDPENHELNGQPGTRVPHLWLTYQGERTSTVDLAATHFTLLTGPAGQDWHAAAEVVAARLQLDLKAYRLAPDGDLCDPEKLWPGRAGIEEDGALLVRPDGFVAWRAMRLPVKPQQELELVLKHLLG